MLIDKAEKTGTKQDQSSLIHMVGESQTGKLVSESYTWQKHCVLPWSQKVMT